MQSIKKIISIICVVIIFLVLLVICNLKVEKIPTCEELVMGSFGTVPVESLSAKINANISANVDMSSIGMHGTMEMDSVLFVDIMGDKDGNSSVNGNVEYNILGMNGFQKIESYKTVDVDNIKNYTYDDITELWNVEVLKGKKEKPFIDSFMELLKIENFDKGSLFLDEIKPDDKVYTVVGQIDSMVIKNSIITSNRLIEIKNLVSDELKFNITMEFDKTTKIIKRISILLDTKNMTEDAKTVYNNLSMEIDVYKINATEICVPHYVLDNINNLSASE
jgi:hypothetical protein